MGEAISTKGAVISLKSEAISDDRYLLFELLLEPKTEFARALIGLFSFLLLF